MGRKELIGCKHRAWCLYCTDVVIAIVIIVLCYMFSWSIYFHSVIVLCILDLLIRRVCPLLPTRVPTTSHESRRYGARRPKRPMVVWSASSGWHLVLFRFGCDPEGSPFYEIFVHFWRYFGPTESKRRVEKITYWSASWFLLLTRYY